MSWERVQEKFLSLTEPRTSPSLAQEIIDVVSALDCLDDITTLTALLAAIPALPTGETR